MATRVSPYHIRAQQYKTKQMSYSQKSLPSMAQHSLSNTDTGKHPLTRVYDVGPQATMTTTNIIQDRFAT